MRGLGTCYRVEGSRFWWIQYWHDGRRHRESTGKIKFREAQDVLKGKLIARANGETPVDHALTVRHLYTALERDYTINQRKSLPDLKSQWRRHLEPHFSRMGVGRLNSDEVGIYIARRQEEKAANGSINRELAALKRMLKLAVKARKIATVPYIPMLQERNVRKGFVKDAQYEALATETATIGLWLRAMFEVAYTYGWRRAELLGMRVGQVDLMERMIELNPGETKNDDPRAVEMTAKVYELLKDCCAGKGADDYVFTRDRDKAGRKPKKGGRIIDFRKDWQRACAAAGVEGLLFHDLRRSGVRNMRRSGVSEKVAMTISGHRTRSVFERYNIVDPSDVRDATGRMERASRDRRQRQMQHSLFEQSRLFEEEPDGGKGPRRAEISAPDDSHRTVIAGNSRLPN